MEGYSLAEAAERSGFDVDELRRLVDFGVLTPNADGRFTSGDLRRTALVLNLTAAGISLEGLGSAIRDGRVSLGFLDAPAFDRFAQVSDVTFREAAEQSGIPLEFLMAIREAAGSVTPAPDDRMRDAELSFVPWIQASLEGGLSRPAMQQLIR